MNIEEAEQLIDYAVRKITAEFWQFVYVVIIVAFFAIGVITERKNK